MCKLSVFSFFQYRKSKAVFKPFFKPFFKPKLLLHDRVPGSLWCRCCQTQSESADSVSRPVAARDGRRRRSALTSPPRSMKTHPGIKRSTTDAQCAPDVWRQNVAVLLVTVCFGWLEMVLIHQTNILRIRGFRG